MSSRKTMKWIFAAFLIGIVAGGVLSAWAAAPDAEDEEDVASVEPGGYYPGRRAASVTVPARITPQPNPRTDFDARLIGTAVVKEGRAFAVLQLTTGTRIVREGEDILPGMRLVKVWRDRIDVERAGVRQNIRQSSNLGPQVGGETILANGEAVQGNVDRLWETQGRMGRSLFYSHYRRSQN